MTLRQKKKIPVKNALRHVTFREGTLAKERKGPLYGAGCKQISRRFPADREITGPLRRKNTVSS